MLKFIDGFDQCQGQSGQALLSTLTAAGYTVSSGLAMADGRNVDSYALELQVAAGTAGESWSSRTNNVRQDLYGIAANAGGTFVAVGANGVAVGSDDNITWLPIITGVSAALRAIKNFGNTWVIVGANSTILRSLDGRNFVPRNAPVTNANLLDVHTDGDGTWVAVGALGALGCIFVSVDDGITWGTISSAGSKGNNVVSYGENWVVGGAGGQLLTSPDGLTWNDGTVGVDAPVNGLAFAPGVNHWLAAVSDDIMRSINGGTTWAPIANGILAGQLINSLAYSDGRWMAVGNGGEVRMSDNESDWIEPSFVGAGTTPLYDVCATYGARAGWALCGAQNLTVPGVSRTAVIYVSLAPPTRVSRRFTTASNKFTVGFAHRSTARGKIVTIEGLLDMDWPAGIEINDELSVSIPARNVWYYYELTIDKVALTVTLHINDTLDLTAPIDAAAATQNVFDFTWLAENGAVSRIDDIYFLDSSAPNAELLVERIGPITIPLRLPDADVLKEWVPATGTEHWPLVGLLPPSPESYIRSNVSGAQDLFTSSTPLPVDAGTPSAPIIAVGVIALAMKGDIDNRQMGLVVGEGVDQKEVIDTVLSVVPEYSYGIFEKAPGDVAWDATNTVTTPFGVVVRS